MAGKNEVTITIRAVDAATAIIKKVGDKFSDFGKFALRSIKSLFGPLLQLKTYLAALIGGGALAAIVAKVGQLSNSLAVNAQHFDAAFSPERQGKIDAVASAFNRFVASIRATLGNVIGANGDAIVGFFDSISNWLAKNQDRVIKGVHDVAKALQTVISGIKELAEAAVENGKKIGSFFDAVFMIGQALGGAKAQEFKTIAETLAGGPKGIRLADTGGGWWDRAAIGINNYVTSLGGAVTKSDAAVESTERLVKEVSAVPPAVVEAVDWFAKWKAAADEMKARLDAIAGVITDRFLDALTAVIKGTKSVAVAFKEMAASILEDIGRLLLREQIFKFISGLLGSAFQTPASPNPAAGYFGASSIGSFSPRASGGRVSAGKTYNVGENGPERFTPDRGGTIGTSAQPSIAIHQTIVGGNPEVVKRQTVAAVLQALREDRQFRRAVHA